MYRLNMGLKWIGVVGFLFVSMTGLAASTGAEPTISSHKDLVGQLPTKDTVFNVMPATREGRQWLALMDRGAFDKCWDRSSVLVREHVEKKTFIEGAKKSRGKLGAFVKRTIRMARPQTQLAGGPKGHYVLLSFKSQFEANDDVTEMMMLQLDPDKQWRVAAYFIK